MRKSPSDYAGIISNLSPGLTIKLDGVVVDYNGKSWYKIYTNNQYCYILEKDVKLVNATTQAAKYIGYSPSIVGYTSKRMIVRSTTSETSVGIGTFRKDTSIKLNGLYTGSDGVQWYKVITNKQTGYVLKREVNLKPVEVSPLHRPRHRHLQQPIRHTLLEAELGSHGDDGIFQAVGNIGGHRHLPCGNNIKAQRLVHNQCRCKVV